MNTTNHLPPTQADALLERYYDGMTNDEEERSLRFFLVSAESDGGKYDADRAVMGLLATGRKSKPARRPVLRHMAGIAAAACVLLVAGMWAYHSYQQPDCFAYINGERITDETVVK